MKLTTARDGALISAAVAAGLAAGYLILDGLLGGMSWPTEPARDVSKVYLGVHGDLYEVAAGHNGAGRGSYVRPASEEEAKSSEAAELVDDGPGVFAVNEDGTHVLPGTPEWDGLLAPQKYGRTPVTYYRVG